jgi:hypothetical protein
LLAAPTLFELPPSIALGLFQATRTISEVMLTEGTQTVTTYLGAAARSAAHVPGRHRLAAIGIGP